MDGPIVGLASGHKSKTAAAKRWAREWRIGSRFACLVILSVVVARRRPKQSHPRFISPYFAQRNMGRKERGSLACLPQAGNDRFFIKKIPAQHSFVVWGPSDSLGTVPPIFPPLRRTLLFSF